MKSLKNIFYIKVLLRKQFTMCLRFTNFQLSFNWINLQLVTNFDGLLDILHSSRLLSFVEHLNYK